MASHFNYGRMQGTASRLMAKFDQGGADGILLIQTLTTAGDPATPWIPITTTVTTYRVDGVVRRVEDKYLANSLVKATDDQCSFGVIAKRTHINGIAVPITEMEVTPSLIDQIVIDGRPAQIIHTIPKPGAGKKVVHTVICRS